MQIYGIKIKEKESRQQKILQLINKRAIGTQQELMRELKRAGFPATQSRVSRALEELGVVKAGGKYVLPQAPQGADAQGLLELVTAGDFLVVARCLMGLASAVAVKIDDAKIEEIVGTLAGEDTIFVAVANRKAQRIVIKKIWELFL
ncbi:MAG: arginine repressor [Pyrinomonadaceae bacterium]